jgi:competence protein ComEC
MRKLVVTLCLLTSSLALASASSSSSAPPLSSQSSVVSASIDQKEYAFVASRHSDKFHLPSCRYARQIKPANLIGFKTREEAVTAGYVPCKVCRP